MRLEFDEDEYDFDPEAIISRLVDNLLAARVKAAVQEKFEQIVAPKLDALLTAEIERKLMSFMSEEISIGGDWGKVRFVGSIEDLIKQRFDEKLMRSVDSGGKTLQGCTSSSRSWIEWTLEKSVDHAAKDMVESASAKIKQALLAQVNAQMTKIFEETAAKAVSDKLTAVLQR